MQEKYQLIYFILHYDTKMLRIPKNFLKRNTIIK